MLREPLEALTTGGRYGGAIVRLRRGDEVSGRVFDIINMRYDGKTNSVKPFEETIQEFMKFGNKDLIKVISSSKNGQLEQSPVTLEIIPCLRTNLGQRSYPRYEEDLLKLTNSKILKTYVEEKFHRLVGIEDIAKNGAYLYSMMAVRNAEAVTRGRGNILASAFHSFSAPLANSLLINKENQKLNLSAQGNQAQAQQNTQEPVPQ